MAQIIFNGAVYGFVALALLAGAGTKADTISTTEKADKKAGITAPGKDKESNWLPALNDTIYLVMRLYWPRTDTPSILPAGAGSWQPPGIVQVK
jgi:hypothetical protein